MSYCPEEIAWDRIRSIQIYRIVKEVFPSASQSEVKQAGDYANHQKCHVRRYTRGYHYSACRLAWLAVLGYLGIGALAEDAATLQDLMRYRAQAIRGLKIKCTIPKKWLQAGR